MGESPPAPAAPEDAAASEKTAAQEKTPRAEGRRLRVPTSVLVTVLVAALSVWVAPAFTRQWEDRKQARQLQAQVAEQIALATARFDNRGRDARASRKEWRAIVNDWEFSHTRIEARLRVYFSPELRSSWTDFRSWINAVAFLVREAHIDPLQDPGKIGKQLKRVNERSEKLGVSAPVLGQSLTDTDVHDRRAAAVDLLAQ